MPPYWKTKNSQLLVYILTIGVFGIINTEMGVIGILPLIADTFHITVPEAGWTISAFALVVALSGPITPLLFSGINRKKVMLLTLSIFVLSNIISIFATNYTVILVARIIPAFFQPIYVSMALTVAAASVKKEEAPQAISKVFIGVSAGMVLGVPVTSFIAGETSFSMAMVFFAIVNALVLLATFLFVPSMPVAKRLSYGSQLRVLKNPITWHSLIAVILINAAIFGFFSYLSDYLKNITELPFKIISVILFIYGGANIIGNITAGKLLAKNASKTILITPFLLGVAYVFLFMLGELAWPMALIIFFLGILTGIASNNSQYMMINAAPEVPDFANGLFLTAANLGTMTGTIVCGLFISELGTRYSVTGTIIFLTLSIIIILIRRDSPRQKEKKGSTPSLL